MKRCSQNGAFRVCDRAGGRVRGTRAGRVPRRGGGPRRPVGAGPPKPRRRGGLPRPSVLPEVRIRVRLSGGTVRLRRTVGHSTPETTADKSERRHDRVGGTEADHAAAQTTEKSAADEPINGTSENDDEADDAGDDRPMPVRRTITCTRTGTIPGTPSPRAKRRRTTRRPGRTSRTRADVMTKSTTSSTATKSTCSSTATSSLNRPPRARISPTTPPTSRPRSQPTKRKSGGLGRRVRRVHDALVRVLRAGRRSRGIGTDRRNRAVRDLRAVRRQSPKASEASDTSAYEYTYPGEQYGYSKAVERHPEVEDGAGTCFDHGFGAGRTSLATTGIPGCTSTTAARNIMAPRPMPRDTTPRRASSVPYDEQRFYHDEDAASYYDAEPSYDVDEQTFARCRA